MPRLRPALILCLGLAAPTWLLAAPLPLPLKADVTPSETARDFSRMRPTLP